MSLPGENIQQANAVPEIQEEMLNKDRTMDHISESSENSKPPDSMYEKRNETVSLTKTADTISKSHENTKLEEILEKTSEEANQGGMIEHISKLNHDMKPADISQTPQTDTTCDNVSKARENVAPSSITLEKETTKQDASFPTVSKPNEKTSSVDGAQNQVNQGTRQDYVIGSVVDEAGEVLYTVTRPASENQTLPDEENSEEMVVQRESESHKEKRSKGEAENRQGNALERDVNLNKIGANIDEHTDESKLDVNMNKIATDLRENPDRSSKIYEQDRPVTDSVNTVEYSKLPLSYLEGPEVKSTQVSQIVSIQRSSTLASSGIEVSSYSQEQATVESGSQNKSNLAASLDSVQSHKGIKSNSQNVDQDGYTQKEVGEIPIASERTEYTEKEVENMAVYAESPDYDQEDVENKEEKVILEEDGVSIHIERLEMSRGEFLQSYTSSCNNTVVEHDGTQNIEDSAVNQDRNPPRNCDEHPDNSQFVTAVQRSSLESKEKDLKYQNEEPSSITQHADCHSPQDAGRKELDRDPFNAPEKDKAGKDLADLQNTQNEPDSLTNQANNQITDQSHKNPETVNTQERRKLLGQKDKHIEAEEIEQPNEQRDSSADQASSPRHLREADFVEILSVDDNILDEIDQQTSGGDAVSGRV